MPSLPTNNAPNPPTTEGGRIWAFAKKWLRLNLLDLLLMAAIGGASFGIFHAPVFFTRTFPVVFDSSGDVVYPEMAYPDRGWIIPSFLSGVIASCVPLLFYLVGQLWIRSAWDFGNAIMGTTWGLLMTSLVQVTLKNALGGFRPTFLYVCQPDLSRAAQHNVTGLNGSGFHQLMYTVEVCTQTDKSALQNAMTSFPSGHSTVTFAGFGFLFLWLNAKLKVWADYRPAFWKLFLVMLPLLAILVFNGLLTVDAAHNWYDIVAGSLLGAMGAFASYRASYAAVWDWRFNHLPLQPRKAFDYNFEGDIDYAGQTITRRVGWGTKRDWSYGGLDGTVSEPRNSGAERSSLSVDQGRQRRVPMGEDAV